MTPVASLVRASAGGELKRAPRPVGQRLHDAWRVPRARLVEVALNLRSITAFLASSTSLLSPRAETPGPTIVLIYAGAGVLAVSVLTLGIGLLWGRA